MKAYVLHDIADFRMENAPDPHPGEGEVLVAVKAVGICGSDIPRIYETGAYSHPLIPGHEFSGIVTALGSNTDPDWLGQRVGVFPLIPCHVCAPCRKQQYEMCRSYSYLGSRRDGGFAEYVLMPQQNLIKLPDAVTFEEAAMLEPMAVAVHAIRRAVPKQGSLIALCGLGTIGLLLLMFLKEAGYDNVLVIGNKDFQKRQVLEMGFDAEIYCDSRIQDTETWIMECTGGSGVDMFFECVGRNETVIQAVNSTAPAGSVMLVGNPHSDMNLPKSVYWKILRNQLQVLGTWNSSFTHSEDDDWHRVLQLLEQQKIEPQKLISHKLPFDSMMRGFHIMRDKSEDYIKIMGVI